MPQQTPRLKLIKPQDPETQDVDQLNANSDRVDKYMGLYECTSATRPSGTEIFVGMLILETDTQFQYYWDGGTWQGRPWFIERFVDALTYWDIPQKAVVFGNTRRSDGNLASIGAPADWGLTSWEEDKADLKVPAGGLWHVQADLAFSGGASASREYRFDTQDEYLNTFSQGNGKGFLSGFVYLKKGSTVRLTCFQPGVPSNIAQDNRADPAGRSYLRMRYMGPEGIL